MVLLLAHKLIFHMVEFLEAYVRSGHPACRDSLLWQHLLMISKLFWGCRAWPTIS